MNTTTTTINSARVRVVRVRKSKEDIVPAVPKSLERGIKAHDAIVTSVKAVGSRVTIGAKMAGSSVASGASAVGNFFKGLIKGA